MSTRAATPVLGIMLMMGFTIAAALALFATGGVLIESSQSSLEEDQARESMEDIASQVDRTLAGPQSVGEFSFDGVGDGTPRVQADTGDFRIIQNGTERYNESIGALEFEHDDTTFAYQGGAVWRADATGDAVMVRPPDVHYNFRTLTVPIINITGDVTAEQQTGEMRIGDTTRLYPTDPEDDPNPLEGGSVEVEIKSNRYCTGWEEYFQSQAEGELKERCEEGTEDQVTIEFAVPLVVGDVDEAVKTGDFDAHQNADYEDDEIEEQGENFDVESADGVIEEHRQECANQSTHGSNTIEEGGLYCFDNLDDSVTVDTDSAGSPIDIYVNESTDIDGIVVGNNTTPEVNVYFDGSPVEYGGSDRIGNDNDPSQTVLFFHSDTDFEWTGSGDVHALVYAPESDVDIQASGDSGIDGGIIAQNVTVGSASVEINYGEEFDDFDREFPSGGEPFYFLHIVETEVEFTN